MEPAFNPIQEEPQPLELTNRIRSELKQTAKWAGRFAWMHFVLFGIVFLIGAVGIQLGPWQKSGGFGPTGLLVLILFMVFILLPTIFLFRFSRNARKALKDNDQSVLEEAFYHMQRYWHLMWIYMIIGVALYGLVLFFAVAVTGMKGLSGGGVGI